MSLRRCGPCLALSLVVVTACAEGASYRSERSPVGLDAGVDSSFVSVDATTPDVQPDSELSESVSCGDGIQAQGELCDDGNQVSGDGCSASCRQRERDFSCAVAGKPCVYTGVCGDKVLASREQCDDGNAQAADGCSELCQIEPGYVCPSVGSGCRAAACGDGLRVGIESCDDGNGKAGDGCDEHCRVEAGFVCPSGAACRATTCGDGKVEGSEQCDDKNERPYDGCFRCQGEPVCMNAACVAVCGDGIEFPGEACDDGNTRSGDGCSSTCVREPGFACSSSGMEDPAALQIPIIYRDFRAASLPELPALNLAAGHPDFEAANTGPESGLVKVQLGVDKTPEYAPSEGSSFTTSGAANFRSWYHDDPRVNRTIIDQLMLTRQPNGDYVFESAQFFPLDGRGFVAEQVELPLVDNHNFHFTSELRYWFRYQGNETLEFSGDDDVWVFVNGRLAVDLGGVHLAWTGAVTLTPDVATTFGLELGKIYEVVVFQAERHTGLSQYKLTLRGFTKSRTHCSSVCGDRVVTPDEVCDDGKNDGSYGSCTPGCQGFGPRCGDKVVQAAAGEQCDEGDRMPTDSCENTCRSILFF